MRTDPRKADKFYTAKRKQIITEVAEKVHGSVLPEVADESAKFVNVLYDRTDVDDLEEYDPETLAGIAKSILHLTALRGRGEIIVRVFNPDSKDDGFLTPKLASMIPGEKILISNPYGSFLGTQEKAWWIATGTGVAPFYSMIKSGLVTHKKLIHGVRHLNQFYFEDELAVVTYSGS